MGNVWRFPYITGRYGGGAFVLLYLFFLLIMGLPIVSMEFAVGRASQKSVALSFNALEPKGTKWHIHKYFAIAGNTILMMFYTTIGGWMLAYFYKMTKGDFVGTTKKSIDTIFASLTSNRNEMIFWMVLISVLALVICSLGLEKGVEKITKIMMVSLLFIMIFLVIRAVTLPNAMSGLSFYLKPDFGKMIEAGIGEVIFVAMGQAFFTLSCGLGSLAIFGSYIGRDRALAGEAVSVTVLDTFVALMAGIIIFPACFSFGINPGEGPGLVFLTLPHVFNEMPGGRLWGTLFFLFMTFAALSTIVAVFQNLIACIQDLWHFSTKKATVIVGVCMIVLALPCILGKTDWAAFTIGGKDIMDMEEFIVSNNLLPLGSLVYLLFCVSRYGWGWKNFMGEVNSGQGIKFPQGKGFRLYFTYILPLIILYIFVQGYVTMFKG